MVGDVVQGGPGDDLIDLGYDERQQTFGSAQRDRLSYKDSAFRVIVTLGSPKGRGHAQGDGRDLIVSHPFLALLGSDKGDLLTGSTYGDEILGRGGADHIDGDGGRDVLVDGPLGAASVTTSWWAASAATPSRRTAADDRLVGDASADTHRGARAGRSHELVGGAGRDVITVGDAGRSCVKVDGGAGTDERSDGPCRAARRRRHADGGSGDAVAGSCVNVDGRRRVPTSWSPTVTLAGPTRGWTPT